jgi:3-phosphoshikimate 1-carboxyvinyltransferase
LSDHQGLTTTVEVVPGGPVQGSIRPPGSKSLTNRALICAAFSEGQSTLRSALRSDDTEVMIAALQTIGVGITQSDAGRTLQVEGLPRAQVRRSDARHELFIGNSGTTVRFLTAALSALGGSFRLHGVPRMHERPIGDLVAALKPVCDGEVLCESLGGCPPVVITTAGWSGDRLQVAGNVSSQYLSGLMMAAPISGRQVCIEVVGELVSRPYVEMTAGIIKDFGAGCELHAAAATPGGGAASYFWAAAAITGGEVTVEGLSTAALQGDVQFVDCLEQMGCRVDRRADAITVAGPAQLRGIDVDMNTISDTVQTLSVVALFAEGPTTIRGVAHNRFKETDRIGDLACELRKLGAEVGETADGLVITPRPVQAAMLETYEDHRMAMSLALAGLKVPGVQIKNPACTAKTYPEYFADLQHLIGRSHRWRSE